MVAQGQGTALARAACSMGMGSANHTQKHTQTHRHTHSLTRNQLSHNHQLCLTAQSSKQTKVKVANSCFHGNLNNALSTKTCSSGKTIKRGLTARWSVRPYWAPTSMSKPSTNQAITRKRHSWSSKPPYGNCFLQTRFKSCSISASQKCSVQVAPQPAFTPLLLILARDHGVDAEPGGHRSARTALPRPAGAGGGGATSTGASAAGSPWSPSPMSPWSSPPPSGGKPTCPTSSEGGASSSCSDGGGVGSGSPKPPSSDDNNAASSLSSLTFG
jgi:hypothetical protein